MTEPTMTQRQHMEAARQNEAGGNEAMMDLLFGPNPLAPAEEARLVERRPDLYGRFAGYLPHTTS